MKKQIFILILFFSAVSLCQVNKLNNDISGQPKQNHPALPLFYEIESGISKGNIQSISRHLSNQTYFSFFTGVNGYYSSNQAFYVLEDFFKINQVISFRFQNIQTDNNSCYATGVYMYENKGKRSHSQVYLSLMKIGNNWKINQITIN